MAVIDTLTDQFQQLEKLCKKVPSQNSALWDKCRQEAEKELLNEAKAKARKQNREAKKKREAAARASGLDSGSITSSLPSKTSEQKARIPKPAQREIDALALEKYLQADPNYVKKLSQLKNQLSEVAKQIDHTLLDVRKTTLLTYGRAKNTLLAADWPRIRDGISLNWLLRCRDDGLFSKTIDTLEYIKADINLQKQLEVKSQAQEQKSEEPTIPKPSWNSPKGYIRTSTIMYDYHVPRTTLEGWQSRDDVPGGILKGKVKHDPITNENCFPKKWFDKKLKTYKPRKKSNIPQNP